MNVPISIVALLIVCLIAVACILTLTIKSQMEGLQQALASSEPLTRLTEAVSRVAAVEEGKQRWYEERRKMRQTSYRSQYQRRDLNENTQRR